MARLPVSGSDEGVWGDLLNEYLLVEHRPDGTHDLALGDLKDVTAATATANQVLKYDGNKWVPAADTTGNVADGSVTEQKLSSDVQTKLNTTAPITSVNGQTGDVTVSRLLSYAHSGDLFVRSGTHRLYNDSGADWTIASVRVSVGTPPTGSGVVIDINKNGTTIFTNQANRPTIADAADTSGKLTVMNVTTVTDGEYLTVDIDQIGSGAPGIDLTVQIEIS